MGAYWLVRREEGMGLGDVKLVAMMGAFLGAIPAVPFILIGACIIGSVIGLLLMLKRGSGLKTQVPFGPFLAITGVVYLFFGEALIRDFLPTWTWMAGQ